VLAVVIEFDLGQWLAGARFKLAPQLQNLVLEDSEVLINLVQVTYLNFKVIDPEELLSNTLTIEHFITRKIPIQESEML